MRFFYYSSVKESIHFTMNDIDVSRYNTSEKMCEQKKKNETNDNTVPRFVMNKFVMSKRPKYVRG